MSKNSDKLNALRKAAMTVSTSESHSADALLTELSVYQVELEMQNEQLRGTQLELEKARDRYADFYDFAPVGYLTLDRDGMVLDANLTAAAMLGVERIKLKKSRFVPFVAIDDLNRWYRHFFLTLKTDAGLRCELKIRKACGASFNAGLDCLRQTRDDGETSVRIVLTDITQSVIDKEALRASEHKFRTLTDAMPQMVWIAKPSGEHTYLNQKWVDYTGLSLEESYGHGWIEPFHPDDRQRAWDAWQHATKTDSIYSVECRLRRADGVYRWWLIRGVSQHDPDGFIVNWFGTCTDITEQKKTEEQLLELLRQRVEKEQAKTRFLAAAGHDLRQPVAAAGLFVYALKHTHPTPQQSELIEKLSQSMSAFSDLLRQLLDISKFDAGVVKPQLATFNLAELCDWLEDTFAETARNQKLKFHLFFTTDKPLIVRTDPGLLRSVLMNLICNAIKFTASGGILISARARGDKVLVQVWDTGIGISRGDIVLIFDEFYQVANQQRNRDAGLGLGLSICQRAMSLLGGEVICHSRPGRGSTFEFSLPLVAGQCEVVQTSGVSSEAVCGELYVHGKRIVVLEDDELVASGMISLLRQLGASVLHFYNAEDALLHDDIIYSDYFIVDYALGGVLTGIGFLDILQQRRPEPLRAVIVTGETSSLFISRAADSRWPLLYKPIEFAKLAAALDWTTPTDG
ncbi:MAG: ATP-binding protein [Gallionella sp.]|nr:ATP-binding protein [Gallionella sp.]